VGNTDLKHFVDIVNQLEQSLDNVVNVGSDDDLFIASYLQGHVSVVAKPMEIQANANVSLLDEKVKENLSEAFENKELEPEDQAKVIQMWNELVGSYLP
jgi:hypothetical protein